MHRAREFIVFGQRRFDVAHLRIGERKRQDRACLVVGGHTRRVRFLFNLRCDLRPGCAQVGRGENAHHVAQALAAGGRIGGHILCNRGFHIVWPVALRGGEPDLDQFLRIGIAVDAEIGERFVGGAEAACAHDLSGSGKRALWRSTGRTAIGMARKRLQASDGGIGITGGPCGDGIARLLHRGERHAIHRLTRSKRATRRRLGVVLDDILQVFDHIVIGIELVLRIEICLGFRNRRLDLLDRAARIFLRVATTRQQQRAGERKYHHTRVHGFRSFCRMDLF